MADLISAEYKSLLLEKHDARSWGGGGKSWISKILPLLNDLPPGPLQLLDFGCGRGTLKPALEPLHPDLTVHEYDPGVRGKEVLHDRPVDFVVCTDVLEHVEEQYIGATLRTLDWLAVHGVFFNIDTLESKSLLPDGRNTHILIKPSRWWKEILGQYLPDMIWTIHEETKFRLVISGKRRKHVE